MATFPVSPVVDHLKRLGLYQDAAGPRRAGGFQVDHTEPGRVHLYNAEADWGETVDEGDLADVLAGIQPGPDAGKQVLAAARAEYDAQLKRGDEAGKPRMLHGTAGGSGPLPESQVRPPTAQDRPPGEGPGPAPTA